MVVDHRNAPTTNESNKKIALRMNLTLPNSLILNEFEGEHMGIYDIALLAECGQLIDVDARTRHDVEVVVEDFGNPRLPDLSDYKRIDSAITNIIDERYQSEDCEDDWDEEREFDQPDREND